MTYIDFLEANDRNKQHTKLPIVHMYNSRGVFSASTAYGANNLSDVLTVINAIMDSKAVLDNPEILENTDWKALTSILDGITPYYG